MIKEKGKRKSNFFLFPFSLKAEPLYRRALAIFIQVLGQDYPHTQSVMISLMMLRLQIFTGMSSEALQQMMANNPDDIIRWLKQTNPETL